MHSNKFPYAIFISIIISMLAVTISGFAMTACMQAIKVDLNLSLVTMQWLIVGYTIFCASLIAIVGQLGDVIGHENNFIIGLSINIIASILMSVGSDISLIMVGTALRGIGLAFIVTNSMSLIKTIVPKESLIKALSLWGILINFGFSIGPLFGGLFASVNWRLLFWINLIFFISSLIIILIYKSQIITIKERKPVDIIGSILLFLGLVTLVLLLSEGPFWGWTSPMNISLYAISPALLILFFYSQTKIARPLIIFSACKKKSFLSSLICVFCGTGCFYFIIYFINYYFLSPTGQNSSYVFAGIATLPALMAASIASLFVKKLTNKIGYKLSLSLGFLLIFTGSLLLLWIPKNANFNNFWWIFIIFGAGLSPAFTVGSPLAQKDMEKKDAGMAAGVFGLAMFLGPSILLPIASSWYTHAEMSYITNSFKSLNLSLSHDDIIKISSAMHSNMHILKNTLANLDLSNNQIHTVISVLKESAEIGFGRAGLVSAIFAAIGCIFCLLFAPGKDK